VPHERAAFPELRPEHQHRICFFQFTNDDLNVSASAAYPYNPKACEMVSPGDSVEFVEFVDMDPRTKHEQNRMTRYNAFPLSPFMMNVLIFP
jgi:hypothetical protein